MRSTLGFPHPAWGECKGAIKTPTFKSRKAMWLFLHLCQRVGAPLEPQKTCE